MIGVGLSLLLVFVLSIAAVSTIARTVWGSFAIGRIFTGSAVAYGSSKYLFSIEIWVAYVDAAVGGFMGIGGYVFLFSFFGLIVVWGANLWSSNFNEVVR